MHGPFDSRNPLVGLSDEIGRLNGRLKTTFADARRSVGLGESELSVLNSVVEAERSPTVPQIGRSLGQPRQIVQRAANAMIEAGLITTEANPDHKRAVLLRATDKGVEVKRAADATADAVAAQIAASLDLSSVDEITLGLRALRKQLESRLRGGVD